MNFKTNRALQGVEFKMAAAGQMSEVMIVNSFLPAALTFVMI